MNYKELVSQIDGSINHVYEDGSEFRVVHREDHDTVYLSSHTGCAMGCRMCHLTETGQTQMRALNAHEMQSRAEELVSRADVTKRINFSFMARGEALLNLHVDYALSWNLHTSFEPPTSRMCISSVFPEALGSDFATKLIRRFGPIPSTLYWSLYSVDPKFRRYWLPQAMDPKVVVEQLKIWQRETWGNLVIHHALIGSNTPEIPSNANPVGVSEILELLDGLDFRVNLVHYNPPNSQTFEPPEEVYSKHAWWYGIDAGRHVKIQPRVGFDVAASCGMFITGKK